MKWNSARKVEWHTAVTGYSFLNKRITSKLEKTIRMSNMINRFKEKTGQYIYNFFFVSHWFFTQFPKTNNNIWAVNGKLLLKFHRYIVDNIGIKQSGRFSSHFQFVENKHLFPCTSLEGDPTYINQHNLWKPFFMPTSRYGFFFSLSWLCCRFYFIILRTTTELC